MSTTSQDSARPAPSAPVVYDLRAFVARLFAAIDVPSLLMALKSCLAITLATGLAFWLDISATITAVTAFMIQMSYVGSTIYRGTLRFIGGSVGAIVGLIVLALFSQDRVLFIGSISLCTGIIVYLLQATRYWYAYILALAALVLVGYGSVPNPQGSFEFVVDWVSGILLAVVVVSLVRGLLWPTLTADVFEQQLRGNFANCQKLLRMTIEALLDGKDNPAELDRLGQSIIQEMVQPQTTLQTAFFDSWQVGRFQASYNLFLDQFNSLAHLLIEVREHLRICQTRPALIDVVKKSEAVRPLMRELDHQMQTLIAALEEPRDGSSRQLHLGQDRRQAIDALFNRMADEIQASGVDLFDKAALLGLHFKLAELGKQIPKLHETLAKVETAEAQAAARADIRSHQAAPPLKPRLIKAVTASLLMIVVPTIWILTNWPMALHRLMLYTSVLACFNALFPAMPRRAILTAIACGVAGGAIMYFAVLRPLDGFLELALGMSLALLPCCYLVNSPDKSKFIIGLFSGMIIIGLMDLSLVQTYSFSTFANNAIGYSGGLTIAIVILQLFANATPEQTFRSNVLAFFHTCGQALDTLSANPPWPEKGKSCLAAEQSRTLKAFKMCGLWSRMLNPRRVPRNDPKKVGELLAAMQGLLFRMEMMEQARFAPPDQPALAPLVTAERNLRESFEQSLNALQAIISGEAAAGELPTSAKIEEYHRQLDALRDDPAVDKTDRGTAGRVLVLAGYYRALAESIDQCRTCVEALDWRQWERSYI